jgi:MFS family permease
MAGFTITQPYQQTRRSELDCGPVCYGSMTSTSSFLGLIGAPLVGAMSDQMGRRFALTIGCLAGQIKSLCFVIFCLLTILLTGALSFVILGLSSSLAGLWLALVPPSLLSHNFTITKAVVADLADPKERAGILGKLGLAAGLGFMVKL